jgi:hypothetical protein
MSLADIVINSHVVGEAAVIGSCSLSLLLLIRRPNCIFNEFEKYAEMNDRKRYIVVACIWNTSVCCNFRSS